MKMGWKVKLAKTLFSGFPLTSFQRGLKYIFVYHDVSDKNAFQHYPVYSTEPDVFKSQITWIKKHFTLVGLTDLVSAQKFKGNLASIVFDDGFKSVLLNAQPVLSKEKIPFTVFINKNAVEQNWLWCSNLFMAHKFSDREYLKKIFDHFSFDQLSYESFSQFPAEALFSQNKLQNDYSVFFDEKYSQQSVYLNTADVTGLLNYQCELGSHTTQHKLLSGCDDQTLNEEILINDQFVSHITGGKVNHFAIPFGFEGTFDERLIEVARERHSFIYSTERTYLKHDLSAVLPRIGLRNETINELTFAVNLPLMVSFRENLR